MKSISNEKITVSIKEAGAEVCSIRANGREYLWQGDPTFWDRQSPILFPTVGRVWDNLYRHQGTNYPMGQHGFARDREFKVVEQQSDRILFSLKSDAQSLKIYPFEFELLIGYQIEGERIIVGWEVKNCAEDGQTMHFQIGAHPGFYYRNFNSANPPFAHLKFEGADRLVSTLVGEKGCTLRETVTVPLHDGILPIDADTFYLDTLLMEESGIKKVWLLDAEKRPYVSLAFDAPVLAVWSPSAANPDAPFVCIEPWYGRCDSVRYNGEFGEREWMWHLAAGESFKASYTIGIEDISL